MKNVPIAALKQKIEELAQVTSKGDITPLWLALILKEVAEYAGNIQIAADEDIDGFRETMERFSTTFEGWESIIGDERDIEGSITINIRDLWQKLTHLLSKVVGVSDPANFKGETFSKQLEDLRQDVGVYEPVFSQDNLSSDMRAISETFDSFIAALGVDPDTYKGESLMEMIGGISTNVTDIPAGTLPFNGFGEAGGQEMSYAGAYPSLYIRFNEEYGFFYVENRQSFQTFNWWGGADKYGEAFYMQMTNDDGVPYNAAVGVRPKPGRMFRDLMTGDVYESYMDSGTARLKRLSHTDDYIRSVIGNCPLVREVTEQELYLLKSNGKLVPGQWYRITDYAAETVTDEDSGCRHAGHRFDILIMASSADTLCDKCHALRHEGDTYFTNAKVESWQIWYSFNPPVGVFQGRNRGAIYRMIDEWGNDCPYDFKNAQFKVCTVSREAGPFTELDGGYFGHPTWDPPFFGQFNTSETRWAYTFSLEQNDAFVDGTVGPGCPFYQNTVKPFGGMFPVEMFGQTVFYGAASNCVIEAGSGGNFLKACNNVYVGVGCFNIYLWNGLDVRFDGGSHDIALYNARGSVFNDGVHDSVAHEVINSDFDGYCVFDGCHNINNAVVKGYVKICAFQVYDTVITSAMNLVFAGLDIAADSDTLNSDSWLSIHATGVGTIRLGKRCGFIECDINPFVDNVDVNIKIGDDCDNIKIVNSDNIQIGNNCKGIEFGAGCHDITIGDACNGNIFNMECAYITLGDDCSVNTFGQCCKGASADILTLEDGASSRQYAMVDGTVRRIGIISESELDAILV